jgi:F420-0:gamma-glutamyl ligase
VIHTITHNSWVSSAGIDGSNAKDHWILYPNDPFKSAKTIWKYLKDKSGVKNLGLIITDSHSQPLRGGAVGFALAYWGFNPLKNYIGTKDIFGYTLKVSRMDIASNLAAAATFVMGEGKEQTPIAIISDLNKRVEFSNQKPNTTWHMIPPEKDMFSPFYKIFKKNKKKL